MGQRITIQDAADLFGVAELTIRRRIKRGELGHEREGRRVYVLLDGDQAAPERAHAPEGDEPLPPPFAQQLIDELRAENERKQDTIDRLIGQQENWQVLLRDAQEQVRMLTPGDTSDISPDALTTVHDGTRDTSASQHASGAPERRW